MTDPQLVHPVPGADLDPWMRQLVTSLLGDPFDDEIELRVRGRGRRWQPERAWGFRDRGRWVATLATEPRRLTVPGGRDVPLDALTAVSVAATHRRQGLLTRMIGHSLDAARARGDVVSALVAAEWPIYGRFGYAPAVDVARYEYHSARRGARVAGEVGRVRQVDRDEVRTIVPAVFDDARRSRAGQLDRDGAWWDRQLGVNGYPVLKGTNLTWLVHEGPDGPDGYLSWKVAKDFELDGTAGGIQVGELVACTDEAYRDLWAYLTGLDLIDEITLDTRPLDEPVRWLPADGRSLRLVQRTDLLWIRLLDVPAALASRTYAVDGHLVLDVQDPAPGQHGAGRVALSVSGGIATATPTDLAADLRIEQTLLASCYLGGHRLADPAFGGSVTELTAGALARVDLMFSTPQAPWNQTYF